MFPTDGEFRAGAPRCAPLACGLFGAEGNGDPEGSREAVPSPLENLNRGLVPNKSDHQKQLVTSYQQGREKFELPNGCSS